MKDITLGDGLRKLDGLRMDFDKKLRGREGEKWLEGYAKFLRGENPWAEETHGGVRFDLEQSLQVVGENPFEVRRHFKVDMSSTAPVKISDFGGCFKQRFLPLIEEDVAPVTLARHLVYDAYAPRVFWELGERHEVKLSHLWEALRAQRNGEDGVLAVFDSNFLFMFGADHSLWVVEVVWNKGGWRDNFRKTGWSISARPFGGRLISYDRTHRVISCVK